ncbi:PREDICTED: single-stranded DNA-binding protein 4 isoform X6 [Cercocebus atys]|uniref:single-stranded DNA-binding protein 4 isoform X6 n=1 Tax=Cercocebus atys TaxID=9531 RepID=UPI0005F3ABE7|nr:PREDICTED: single-stranded DNA-binding protein 4 isoform X6 [Cercocebus atys]
MYAKGGKGSAVPSDSQAREKLALYVYEYLLHIGAQKSAQTFLSEIRWEKNITLGEPPGFLHSWWCVFWDLYCAAPDRREACEHSGEAKAFQDYSAAAAPSPVMGSMAPGDAMAAGPMAAGFFQGPSGSQPSPHNPNAPMMGPPGQPFMSPRFPGGPRPALRMPSQPPAGLPGSQPLLPGTMEPSPRAQELWRWHAAPTQLPYWPRPACHEHGPRSSWPVGQPQWKLDPLLLLIPWQLHDSTNSSENMYTIMNPIGPGAGRANFPLGPGPEGPMAAMSAMEPHHVNGSLGSGDMDGLPKSSPGAVAGLSNAPGTPRDDGEMAAAGTFLHPFPSESVSDCVDSPPAAASGRRGLAGRPRRGGRGARARP